MQRQELWREVLSLFNNSNKQVHIYEGMETVGMAEIENMGIDINSVLGVIVLYTQGISIENWIRVLGQKSNEHNGISQYNSEQVNVDDAIMKGMLMVAQDIAGGVFAINKSRFTEGIDQVWYFAPDTLEWECMDMNYGEFVAWLAQGNTNEFYESMRWETWENDCHNIDFDQVCLIYPFLWSNECDLRTATKKVVPFRELLGINMEYAKKLFA